MSTLRHIAERPRGFTLIEIAVVLSIIVLLVGAAIPFSSGFMREQRLRDIVRELLVMAKTARSEAMGTGRTAAVVFGKKGFGLLRPGEDEPSLTFTMPRGMSYAVIPFGEEKPLRPREGIWLFQPTGLCEPITFRVEEGEAYIAVAFDPLTANISEESYSIP